MENIDNMGRNSLEALSRDNLTEKGKKRLAGEMISGALALSCLAAGLIISRFSPDKAIVSALLYTVGFLIEGIPVFFAAVKGIFTKNLTNAMEILVAIAITACFFSRQQILSVLIPIILNAVHFLEERSIMGGREVIEGLKRLRQSNAVLLDGGKETVVDAKTLKPGQLIVIRPGSGVPIDGCVVEGESDIDQKSLTGEPIPAHVKCGDSVYAGTVNIDGRLTVEVKKEYVDTSFSKILQLLERSEGISIPESRLIDRFMRYYIPFVLAVAAAVALVSRDVSKAIAILVVSCPCGQMLVSSAPMIATLSVAAKRGILIKNSKFIEELTEIDAVVFDKTGTLTEGELSISEISPAEGVSDDELLEAAYAVAKASNHPVSRAVVNAAEQREIASKFSLNVKEIPGCGMEGRADCLVIRFGSGEWLSAGRSAADIGGSVSFVEKNGRILGYICFGDTVRKEAADSIQRLCELGVEKTVMLTGDSEASASLICRRVGIDTLYAKLLPEDKFSRLRELRSEHNVLAVGDGINDALALREADVGIAMGAMGSELAIQSADVALMNNNLINIPAAIKLARYTRSVVYQNLALSIGISAVMMTLSAFGVISALAGSVLHNLGAFAVLINSSKILRIDLDR